MFEKLIESKPKQPLNLRRLTINTLTVIGWVALAVSLAAAEIWFQPARLNDTGTDITMIAVQPPPSAPPAVAKPEKPQAITKVAPTNMAVREAPKTISVTAPPRPKYTPPVIQVAGVPEGTPGSPNGIPYGVPGIPNGAPTRDVPPPPPPPPAVKKEEPKPEPPKVIRKSGGVLQGSATQRIEPSYPPLAKTARVSGSVVVEVTVDESGNVISARAISGHPLLVDAAVNAARRWKFTPTQLSGQAVKVIGTITFNFNL